MKRTAMMIAATAPAAMTPTGTGSATTPDRASVLWMKTATASVTTGGPAATETAGAAGSKGNDGGVPCAANKRSTGRWSSTPTQCGALRRGARPEYRRNPGHLRKLRTSKGKRKGKRPPRGGPSRGINQKAHRKFILCAFLVQLSHTNRGLSARGNTPSAVPVRVSSVIFTAWIQPLS